MIIFKRSCQIGITDSQSQKRCIIVSGILPQKEQLGESFLLILYKKQFKAIFSMPN